MKWFRARKANICSSCTAVINIDDDYFGNSSSAFCKICGVKKQKRDLVYSQESKSYTRVENQVMCFKCKNLSIGHLMGKAVCQEHIGDAVLG